MYKVIAAVNSMIEKADLISNVVRSETGGLFFLYNRAFCWSMYKSEIGDYFLHYYPEEQSPQALARMSEDEDSNYIAFVTYSTSEIKTKEASESFSELYTLLQGRLFDIDSVLDQIISTAA